jgi:hypothetical protein
LRQSVEHDEEETLLMSARCPLGLGARRSAMRPLLGQACPAAHDGGTSELQVRPRGPGVLTDRYPGKSTSSGFTLSAWVQVTPCGPPSTTTKRLPLQPLVYGFPWPR